VTRFLEGHHGNPGRSGHAFSIEAGRVVAEARERLAHVFGLGDPLAVIFTKNATEALNVALFGLLRPGDHVVTSVMEHNSVLRPLRRLEARGVRVSRLHCTDEGELDLGELRAALTEKTRAIVLAHASNVTGHIIPVPEVAEMARRSGALLVLDTAQSAGAVPIDMQSMGIDLLALTGHKSLLGPQGTGALLVGERARECLEPLLVGGTGSQSDQDVHPDFLPDRLEAGTLNGPGIAGLLAALAFVEKQGIANVRAREEVLTRRLIEGLAGIPAVRILGASSARRRGGASSTRGCAESSSARGRVAVVSFTVEGVAPSEVAMFLEEQAGIMCRAGLHCAPLAHRRLGTFPRGAVRLSPGFFTTQDEIDVAIEAVRHVAGLTQETRHG